jgi:hypothetical protein
VHWSSYIQAVAPDIEMADELQSSAKRYWVSFKLIQFPARASTRTMRVPMHWIELDGNMGENGFLGGWLGDDNDSAQPSGSFNWGALAGLAISFVVGGGFWAGVGLVIARMVR